MSLPPSKDNTGGILSATHCPRELKFTALQSTMFTVGVDCTHTCCTLQAALVWLIPSLNITRKCHQTVLIWPSWLVSMTDARGSLAAVLSKQLLTGWLYVLPCSSSTSKLAMPTKITLRCLLTQQGKVRVRNFFRAKSFALIHFIAQNHMQNMHVFILVVNISWLICSIIQYAHKEFKTQKDRWPSLNSCPSSLAMTNLHMYLQIEKQTDHMHNLV